MIYLDNSATTRVLPDAARIAERYMTENFFNPSSAYMPAVNVERDIENAREYLARTMGVNAEEIIFTSGGTEGNNMAIFGALGALRGRGRVVTSAVEHPSVYEPIMSLKNKGYTVAVAPVDTTGRLDIDRFRAALGEDTVLVSVMHVNNESGAVNDIETISAVIKERCPSAVFHVDGVQGFLKMPFSKLKCDLYTISGHKFHAPKGVGALYASGRIRFAGGQQGGGQERGLRSGTLNAPGIMAMNSAVEFYRADNARIIDGMYACKKRLAGNLRRIEDVLINGPSPMDGAPHILNASFMGVKGEVLLHSLEERGIFVSTGSACSSNKKHNRILTAMNISGERKDGAIRFSLSPFNTLEEMDIAAEEINIIVAQLRRYVRR